MVLARKDPNVDQTTAQTARPEQLRSTSPIRIAFVQACWHREIVDQARDAEIIDCGGKMLAPGIVDLGVFAIDREAFRAGGIVRVGLMPDQSPVLDGPGIVQRASLVGKPKLWIHPIAAATKGLQGTDLAEMAIMKEAGARAILLRDVTLTGPAMAAFTRALAWNGLNPLILQRHERACLDATRDAEELLREALGAKKLKELRRQRNRLAETGEVMFTIASAPEEMERALDTFLKLEASGWKAKRGTALAQDTGDMAFIRRAVNQAAARGACEIVTLLAGETLADHLGVLVDEDGHVSWPPSRPGRSSGRHRRGSPPT